MQIKVDYLHVIAVLRIIDRLIFSVEAGKS